MGVQTAFISTRTDESALERRAAYEALVSAGWIPLTYDASIHRLIAPQLPPGPAPPHERRRTQRRPIWEHITTLIDRSDAFVGVYDRTLGLPDRAANTMPWLRFELLRFLASQLARVDLLRGAGFADVNRAIRDADRLERLLVDALATPGELRDALRSILARRTWLFVRHEHGEPRWEPALRDLLAPFADFLRPFDEAVHELSAAGVAELRPVRSAHAELFRMLGDDLAQVPAAAGGPVLAGARVHFAVHALDRDRAQHGGVLYVLLRALFHAGLRSEVLLAGGRPPAPLIRGTALPLGFVDASTRAAHERLREAVAAQLPACRIETRATAAATAADLDIVQSSYVKEFRAEMRRAATQVPPCLHYRIRVANVPGTLWAIVSVATAFDADIRHLSYHPDWDRRGAEHRIGLGARGEALEFELTIAPRAGAAAWNAKELEYQMKCLYGFLGAERVE